MARAPRDHRCHQGRSEMTRSRTSLGQILKDAALRLAREAERYVGASDATICAGCAHARSEHCGCGASCFTKTSDGLHSCECGGFTPKPEED